MPRQLSLFDDLRPAARRSPIAVARGPRAAEALLLDGVGALLDAAAREPALLALPIRLVVPSRSLRQHLAAAVVARRGRSAAGLVVQTLHGLAREVLARAGEAPPRGAPAFDLLARRFARLEPALARPLEGLADGYAAVAGSVRDLLDAGLTPAHADAAEEALADLGGRVASRAAVERARALVRVAARVERAAEQLSIGDAAHLFRRAVELLAADPDAALPTRSLWIHGFAEATGVATDLLSRLLKLPAATLVLDRPPDPARPGGLESAFTLRLCEALAPGAELAAPPAEPLPARPAARFLAPGAEAESREVAVRIGRLLAGGASPERIGVVARDLAPYRRAIRRHFGRLGIPFSGVGERGSSTPAGRRAAALLDLLEGGGTSPCDRWLDAAVSLPRSPPSAAAATPETGGRRLPITARRRVDLRLAVRALGAGRLADLAALAPGAIVRLLRQGRFALPIRQGLRTAAEAGGTVADAAGADDAGLESEPRETEDDAPRASRAAARTVPGEELERARAAAVALVDRFAAWPEEAPIAAHRARLVALLGEELGWSAPPAARSAGSGRWAELRAELRPGVAAVYAALEALAAELPGELPISRSELAQLLARSLGDSPVEAGTDPLGGAGGGVQVLSVTEARGRTFEHLFVVGLNRDVFPRTVREDPLFPDSLRAVLRGGASGDGVLPDMPVKSAGFDEERYLFAQLLAAAPAVTLSWQAADDDGRPRGASPLLARRAAGREATAMATDIAPALFAAAGTATPAAPRQPRPAFEEAILAGIHLGREGWRPLLAATIAEARAELDPAAVSGLPIAGLPIAGSPIAGLPLSPARLAAVRAAVLDEMDPDRGTAAGRAVRLLPGPYFGFIGRLARGDDPRHRDLYVTAVESLAACPWQTFLERLLQVEPTPDPLEVLPGLDPLLVGNAVHAVLERIVARFAAGDRPERSDGSGRAEPGAEPPGWAGREPYAVGWPPPAELGRLVAAAAERVAAEEGIAGGGLARALAERTRPFLAAAREADWSDPAAPPRVLGAELVGELEVEWLEGPGRTRRLFFKADRVDAGPLLTDYKTGKPLAETKRADSRRKTFLRRVREGRSLQAVAYQLGGGAGAVGRYLFLRPELESERREIDVRPDDAEAIAAFRYAVAAALAAWEAGSLFPRLVDVAGRKEPVRCKFCRVAEACLRGDSGARSRLLAYAGEAKEEAARQPDGEAAAFSALWQLAESREDA